MKRGFILFILLASLILISQLIAAQSPDTKSLSLGKQKVIGVYAYPSYLEDVVNRFWGFSKQRLVQQLYGENSVRDFFFQNSYGQMEIVGSDGLPGGVDDIYGPLVLPMTKEECTAELIEQKIYEALKDKNVLENGLTLAILAHMQDCKTSSPAGEHTSRNFGTGEDLLVLSFATDWAPLGLTSFDNGDITHEIGHSFGLGHAMYKRCLFQEGVSPDDCKDIGEHADPYDIMGGGRFTQSNSIILEGVGWLRDDGEHKIRKIGKEDEGTTVYVKPISDASPGVKGIKIPHGAVENIDGSFKETFLYIDWRKRIGLDAKLPEDSNAFKGALLYTNVLQDRYSALFHPFPIPPEIAGASCTSQSCSERPKWAFLPSGKPYTDPNTDTTVKVGFPSEEGLPITIEKIGRTDFTPPEVGRIIKLGDQINPCTTNIKVNPTDKNGISKVQFYELDAGNKKDSKLISELISPPYVVSLDQRNYRLSSFFVRVYDNAKQEGGIAENNYQDKGFDFLENLGCAKRPLVIIESPYLEKPFNSETVIGENIEEIGYSINYFLDFSKPIKNPLPLKIKIKTENYPIELVTISYSSDAITPPTIKSYLFFNEDIYEKEINTELLLVEGAPILFITIRTKGPVGGDSTYINFRNLNVLKNIPFVRGDSNNDGNVDISDAINTLNYLYTGKGNVPCHDAGDANDDGVVDISDAVYTLSYLFQGKPLELPGPSNLEEIDETYDNLVCGHSVCKDGKLSFEYGPGEDEGISDYDCGAVCVEDSDANAEYPDGDNPFVKGEINPPEQERVIRIVGDSCSSPYPYYLIERKCGPNKSYQYKKVYNCPELGDYVCKEGACQKARCKDSDATREYIYGDNSELKGTVIFDGGEHIDFCNPTGTLTEYYCNQENLLSKRDISCKEGYVCRDGACIEKNWHSICQNNVCVQVEGKGDDQCKDVLDCGGGCPDTDVTEKYPRGDNPFIKGKMREMEDKCYEWFGSKISLGEVYCTNENKVSEKVMSCSSLGAYICKDGACVPA